VGGIVKVDGLGNENEVVDYQHGEENLSRKRAARLNLAPVTLTRTWANNKEFFNWRRNVVDGKTDRRSVSIIFLSDAKTESGRINLFSCWPSKWTGPNFNAMSSDQAVETLVLQIEDMQYA
jgi:phage tail-like protein